MNRRTLTQLALGGVLVAALSACAVVSEPERSASPTVSVPPVTAPTDAPSAEATTAPSDDDVVGTVVRFSSDRTSVDVTISADSPAVRDFLSRLPLDVTFEEFAGREKITYLEPDLNWQGSPGFDPSDGDLIYYTPWGNLGFYYNADGIHYSDATLEIGTYDASAEQLALLEGSVRIEVVE